MFQTAKDARTWAQIDLGALKRNLDIAKRPGAAVMCVIKADAYGHGAIECGRFLQANGADAFAVACLSEALELRNAGITLPILVFGYTGGDYAQVLAQHDLTQTLVDEAHACELNAAATRMGVQVKCHIKLDTGMSRSGLFAQGEPHDAVTAAARMHSLAGIRVTGLYSHLCVADAPSGEAFTRTQYERFIAVRDGLIALGIDPGVCHIANSAAILSYPWMRLDMVREGIMLYGLYPDNLPREAGALSPVMTLKSRVVQLKEVPAGATVSYGRRYTAAGARTLAVIGAGYADGYSRKLSNNGWITVNGRRCEQVGTVCMDAFMADVTGLDVARGDEVVLFGEGGMSLEEFATRAGTINYEIPCLVTARARRAYVNG
ncbi:MAG: alanine racemase [Clostridia bacterium]|nr:alanine racemase [Clostridia bacterium]